MKPDTWQGLFNAHTVRFLVLGLTIWLLKKAIVFGVKRFQRSRRSLYKVAIAGGILLLTARGAQAQATPTPVPTATPYTIEGAHADDVLQRRAILFLLALIFGGNAYAIVQRRVRL